MNPVMIRRSGSMRNTPHLGKRIKLIRTERGVTQEELGKYLNVGKSTISQYETNKSTPDPVTITKIADYFNVSTDYLLGRTEYRNYPHTQAAHIAENESEYPLKEKDIEHLERLLRKAREDLKKKGL